MFCYEYLLSRQPDADSYWHVSIVIHRYVQTENSTPISTMHKFINTASWKPVPRGLASNAEFSANSVRLSKLTCKEILV
jgi:hypothetical protein